MGAANLNMLDISYPDGVTVRNCIFFSLMPGAFARAIDVVQFGDPDNQLYLYNDDLANYGIEGLRVELVTVDSAQFVMRNVVAINDPTISPEPHAHSSGTSTNRLAWRTSCNTAFASAASVEKIDLGASTSPGQPRLMSSVSIPR